jgi:hypothetical protein
MESKQVNKTIEQSAAKAGFCTRSSYNLKKRCNNPAKREKYWRSTPDPFLDVWETDLVCLLKKNPKIQAKTLLKFLQDTYKGQFPDKLLRTLQRRIKDWKLLSGPAKEVIFCQTKVPGFQGISDFTCCNELEITIHNIFFPHRLYHYRLTYSGWEYAQVVQGGESFTALSEGFQNALWLIGGVTKTNRTDSLSAAYKNKKETDKEDFTKAYSDLCQHYGVIPTRNNKGKCHENGAIESPNGHLKSAINQKLMLRKSRDFDSIDEYKAFIKKVIDELNQPKEARFLEEKKYLDPLPKTKTCDYSEEIAVVTSSSTIRVRGVIYSVYSQLIGETLKIHLYDDRIECFAGCKKVITLNRVRKQHKHCHRIDYHHVIDSLAKKPHAFSRYVYKDDLLINIAFTNTWNLFLVKIGEHEACREYVKILKEAARPEGEAKVTKYLEDCLMNDILPTSKAARALFVDKVIEHPVLTVVHRELSDYDELKSMVGVI